MFPPADADPSDLRHHQTNKQTPIFRERRSAASPNATLARGEFNLRGFQNKTLHTQLDQKTSAQLSRLLKRLRLHGLIKKVGHSYRYYLTALGKHVVAPVSNLRTSCSFPTRARTRKLTYVLPDLVRTYFQRP
jgi:hypothetical protein